MVGSGAGSDRSKEAVGMMALHEALRTVCLNSDWTYSVFWTIRPRPYMPPLLTLSLCCVCFGCLQVYLFFPISLSLSLSLSADVSNLECQVFVLFPQLGLCPFASCRRVRGGNGCKVGDDNGSLWVYTLSLSLSLSLSLYIYIYIYSLFLKWWNLW